MVVKGFFGTTDLNKELLFTEQFLEHVLFIFFIVILQPKTQSRSKASGFN